MNKLLILTILCIACAVLKSLLAVLIIALALSLFWGLLTKPLEALLTLGAALIGTFWSTHPIACFISLLVTGCIGIWLYTRRQRTLSKALEVPKLLG